MRATNGRPYESESVPTKPAASGMGKISSLHGAVQSFCTKSEQFHGMRNAMVCSVVQIPCYRNKRISTFSMRH